MAVATALTVSWSPLTNSNENASARVRQKIKRVGRDCAKTVVMSDSTGAVALYSRISVKEKNVASNSMLLPIRFPKVSRKKTLFCRQLDYASEHTRNFPPKFRVLSRGSQGVYFRNLPASGALRMTTLNVSPTAPAPPPTNYPSIQAAPSGETADRQLHQSVPRCSRS